MLYGGSSSCGSNLESFVLPVPPAGAQGTPFPGLSASVACTSSQSTFDYSVMDFNGDGRADLVVTRACQDANVGVSVLLVYLNTGSAFAPATQYGLPSLPTSANCVQSALVDVDGDLNLDFVVTSLCTDATVGTTRWLVYHNTGTGFDLAGQSYTLPTDAGLHAFPSLEVDAPSCQGNQPAFAFYDITGDLIPDVVVTTACDDTSVGITSWRVYPGTATGVTAPIAFTLPGNSFLPTPLGGALACAANALSEPSYTVVDFNGDQKPDLVVTQSCTDGNAGTAHWSVYPNSGAAFATTPTFIPLPGLNAQPSGTFDALSASSSCTNNVASSFTHAFVDFDGDLKPDVVVTQSCGDSLVGADYWLVLRNTGTSFEAPEVYELPSALNATQTTPANNLTGALACTASHSSPAFASAPFFGTALDVIVTASCTDSSIGSARWLVFEPSCP